MPQIYLIFAFSPQVLCIFVIFAFEIQPVANYGKCRIFMDDEKVRDQLDNMIEQCSSETPHKRTWISRTRENIQKLKALAQGKKNWELFWAGCQLVGAMWQNDWLLSTSINSALEVAKDYFICEAVKEYFSCKAVFKYLTIHGNRTCHSFCISFCHESSICIYHPLCIVICFLSSTL